MAYGRPGASGTGAPCGAGRDQRQEAVGFGPSAGKRQRLVSFAVSPKGAAERSSLQASFYWPLKALEGFRSSAGEAFQHIFPSDLGA